MRALLTIESPQRPTLAEAAKLLRVAVAAMDETFGVVAVDPARGLYAVSVDADALAAAGPLPAGVRGPFANPPIEPLDR